MRVQRIAAAALLLGLTSGQNDILDLVDPLIGTVDGGEISPIGRRRCAKNEEYAAQRASGHGDY